MLELKMAPWVKTLATKSAHLSSIPGPTQGMESDNHACTLSSYLQIHYAAHMNVCMCTLSLTNIQSTHTYTQCKHTCTQCTHTYAQCTHTMQHTHSLIHNMHTMHIHTYTQYTHTYAQCTHTYMQGTHIYTPLTLNYTQCTHTYIQWTHTQCTHHILTHNAHTQNDSSLRDCGIKTVLKVCIGGPSPSDRGPPYKKKVCIDHCVCKSCQMRPF